MNWFLVLVIAVPVAALAFVAGVSGRQPSPPPRAPGRDRIAQRPSNHWPQAVYVRHDIHVWHHGPDDNRTAPNGQAVPGNIEHRLPRALPAPAPQPRAIPYIEGQVIRRDH